MPGEKRGEHAIEVEVVPLDQRADRRGADDERQVEGTYGAWWLRLCDRCHPVVPPIGQPCRTGCRSGANLSQQAKDRNARFGQTGNFLCVRGSKKKARRISGPFPAASGESPSQQGAQSFRHLLVENVIVERVEEVFPIGLAGKK